MVLTMAQTMYYDELNRREDDWITFLQDHRSNLIANSKLYILTKKIWSTTVIDYASI